MKTIKLFLVAFAIHALGSAQIGHVSIGYGPMEFPSVNDTTTDGGVAYLSIGGDDYGGTLFIGGDSRISYGGEDYGSGMVGLAGFHDIEFGDSGIKVGVFVGITGFQTYEKVDITQGKFKDPSPFPRPQLKETNVQPYGGLRLVIKFIEIQYAPASNMITAGFILFRG